MIVPPSFEPDGGLTAKMAGVRMAIWKVNGVAAFTRSSVAVPEPTTTVIVALRVGVVAPRSTAGVTTTIWVAVTEETVPSLGVPLPVSNSTRAGARKLVPVMVTTSPPWGLPKVGVNDVMVGAVDPGPG